MQGKVRLRSTYRHVPHGDSTISPSCTLHGPLFVSRGHDFRSPDLLVVCRSLVRSIPLSQFSRRVWPARNTRINLRGSEKEPWNLLKEDKGEGRSVLLRIWRLWGKNMQCFRRAEAATQGEKWERAVWERAGKFRRRSTSDSASERPGGGGTCKSSGVNTTTSIRLTVPGNSGGMREGTSTFMMR